MTKNDSNSNYWNKKTITKSQIKWHISYNQDRGCWKYKLDNKFKRRRISVAWSGVTWRHRMVEHVPGTNIKTKLHVCLAKLFNFLKHNKLNSEIN